MEIDDRYTRITLRIPKDLHARLAASAEETSKSMNAEIVARLQESFAPKQAEAQETKALQLLRHLHEESQARLAELRSIRNPTDMDRIELEHEERAAKNLRHTIVRSLQFLTDSFPQAESDK